MDWVNELFSPEVKSAALGLFNVAVVAGIGYLSTQLRKKTGIELSAKVQNDMHKALTTGAEAILAGQDLKAITAEMREEFVQYVKDYAWRSSPDALGTIANGKPVPDDVLDTLARAKLNVVSMQMLKAGS